MSATEAAWAAGFFDGEGYSSVSNRKPQLNGTRARTQLMVTIQQSGPEAPRRLRRFARAVGCGTVSLTRHAKGAHMEVYRWQIGSISGGLQAMRVLWPHLDAQKKTQFITALRKSARDFRLRRAARGTT